MPDHGDCRIKRVLVNEPIALSGEGGIVSPQEMVMIRERLPTDGRLTRTLARQDFLECHAPKSSVHPPPYHTSGLDGKRKM